jgi:hypothetical protein
MEPTSGGAEFQKGKPMKTLPYLFSCVLILCAPAFGEGKSITAEQMTWLKSCGVLQSDIDVYPNISRRGQIKLWAAASLPERQCEDIAGFKATREFLHQIDARATPHPLPPNGYSPEFLTADERAQVQKAMDDAW